jgi:hypothetical protein
LQHQRLLRVDLAARARERRGSRLHEVASALDPASLPPRRDLLGIGPPRGPFFDLAVDRVPARSYRRSLPTTSLVYGDPGELGPLPRGSFSLEGAQPFSLGLRARVGAARRRPRSSRPMSAAHGFCFQRRSPHVSAHVASSVPTRCEGSRFHAAIPTSASRRAAPRCCLPRLPISSAYL